MDTEDKTNEVKMEEEAKRNRGDSGPSHVLSSSSSSSSSLSSSSSDPDVALSDKVIELQSVSTEDATPSTSPSRHMPLKNEPETEDDETLPYWPLFALCCVIGADAFAITMLFPFINQMVGRFMGLSPDDADLRQQIGYYSGYLASAFFLSQTISSFFWGWISDQAWMGKKSALTLIALVVMTFILKEPKVPRLVEVVTTDTIKTVSSDDLEMAMTATTTDSSESNSRSNLIKDAAKTHHIAMGGKTEDENDLHIDMDETPDQRDKATHAENEEDVVTLEEEDIVTLDDCAFDDAKEDVVDGVDGVTTEELHHPDNSGHAFTSAGYRPSRTVAGEIRARIGEVSRIMGRHNQTIIAMICYAMVAFVIIAVDEVFPLFAYTGLMIGGLDFGPADTGMCWLITGVSLIVFQGFFYHRVANAVGVLWAMRIGAVLLVTQVMLTPMLHFPRTLMRGLEYAGDPDVEFVHSFSWYDFSSTTIFWLCIVFVFVLRGTGAPLLFTSSNIIILNSSKLPVGMVNGIGATMGGIMKAAGPSVCNNLFAFSSDSGFSWPFNNYLTFYFLAGCVIVMAALTFFIRPSLGFRSMHDK